MGLITRLIGPSSAGSQVLLPTAMSHSQATALGLKVYSGIGSIIYNNGATPTLTGTPAGYSPTLLAFIPYQVQDGSWRLKFNMNFSFSSAASANFTSITGVTNPTLVQAITASVPAGGGSSTITNSSVRSGNWEIDFTSGTVTSVCLSGDISILGKPTWAY